MLLAVQMPPAAGRGAAEPTSGVAVRRQELRARLPIIAEGTQGREATASLRVETPEPGIVTAPLWVGSHHVLGPEDLASSQHVSTSIKIVYAQFEERGTRRLKNPKGSGLSRCYTCRTIYLLRHIFIYVVTRSIPFCVQLRPSLTVATTEFYEDIFISVVTRSIPFCVQLRLSLLSQQRNFTKIYSYLLRAYKAIF
jgi:hypothetical protein